MTLITQVQQNWAYSQFQLNNFFPLERIERSLFALKSKALMDFIFYSPLFLNIRSYAQENVKMNETLLKCICCKTKYFGKLLLGFRD